MLIERLFENLALDVEPFALCDVSPGWRLRMDGLDWVTFHFVLQGEGRLRTGDSGVAPLRAASLAVVPPRMRHAIESGDAVEQEASTSDGAREIDGMVEFRAGPGGDADMLVACGRVQASLAGGVGLFDLMREAIVLDFADSGRMRETFSGLLEEQRAAAPGQRAMMAALMHECLVLVFRRLCDAPDCALPWLSALDDPRVAAAVDSILEEPDRPHTLDSLAAKAYMSRSAFAHHFTTTVGRTPMAFVRDVRMRQGAILLRTTDLSVDAIARRVGFSSRSHFSRAFREYFGSSPAHFRVLSAEPAV